MYTYKKAKIHKYEKDNVTAPSCSKLFLVLNTNNASVHVVGLWVSISGINANREVSVSDSYNYLFRQM